MYEKLAWNSFELTGSIESFLEYKRIMELRDLVMEYQERENISESYESERNSN